MYLGKEPAAIRSYALAYKKDIERARWRPSTADEFRAALTAADVIFGGDFHAFAQAQRVHLRNLRNLAPYKKIVLAMECVPSRFQKPLDQFLARQISEAEFLKKVRWEKNWGFAWGQYKPLFDLVREQGGRGIALNLVLPQRSLGALKKRDRHAADILAHAYRNKRADEAIYVVYGDLHVARERLPALFQKAAKRAPAPRVLTVFLNPEKIYFQLFKKNLEHAVSVIRFSRDEFCLLESPPWVKWQSYLIFLEETLDESLYEDDGSVDYSDHVDSLLKMMAADLGVEAPSETSVYSFNDHDFLDLLNARLDDEDFALVKKFVQNDIGFFEPRSVTAFLPRGTVNYAAHLAGHIFHCRLSGRKTLGLKFPQQFVALVWLEAVAFFLSKLVNPHRKSLALGDLKKQLAVFSPGDRGEQALKLALDQKMRDLILVYGGNDEPPRGKQDEMNYYKAAKLLGAMMGERLHWAFKTGRLSRAGTIAWLKQSVDGVNFQDFYIQVLRDLDSMEVGDA